jgi:hypothetical protein
MQRVVSVFVVILLLVTCLSMPVQALSERFEGFLIDSAEMICRFAHPTNSFVRSYINDYGTLVIVSRSSFSDSIQYLKIRISEDFDTFKVISDDSWVPAFAAVSIIKNFLVDLIRDISEDSSSSDSQRRVANVIFDKIEEMNGLELAYGVLIMKWLGY